MTTSVREKTPLSQFYGPKYWPTWLGLWLMWILAHLPHVVQVKAGQALGYLAYVFAKQRREICRINLELCFPELSSIEQKRLVRKSFASNGIALMEVAIAWCRDPEDYRQRIEIKGLEHVKKAKQDGKGVLLLSAHFSTLEMAGILFSIFEDMDVSYRKHKNPLFDAVMSNSRKQYFPAVIERKNVREALRSLKNGHILWYAPDQDYGAKHSVFVPFFGVEAATITATARFARSSDAAVVFFTNYRSPDNSKYHLEFSPVISDYPSGDDVADATRINKIIEDAIKQHPEQYLWMHKRFKTQLMGKKASPYSHLTG